MRRKMTDGEKEGREREREDNGRSGTNLYTMALFDGGRASTFCPSYRLLLEPF
jgi:hypothetical protein